MSKTFSELGLSQIVIKSLADCNIITPTEIQEKVIPEILTTSNDVVGLAKTGTGKTAAFGLPLLEQIKIDHNVIQGVILAPTRELGQQIFNTISDFAKYIPELSITLACGGVPIKPQIERLSLSTHIVVATPGRLIDLIQRDAVSLKHVSHLVLDEADEMLSALKDGLDKIVAAIPKQRRTYLFSATMPGAIKQLIQNYMSKHITQVSADVSTTGNVSVDHKYVVVEPIEKLNVLMHFLSSQDGKQGIIFCKTKAAVNKLAKNLAINRFSSGALHGSLSQGIRDRIMGQFRDHHISILVATDLAARGIDIKDLAYVVNYHLPDTYEAYVHRSGRTARAGASGLALSVIQDDELQDIPDFEDELQIQFTELDKPDDNAVAENNTVLWAKKIFKTKPNRELSPELKNRVKTVFHHLTKDELIEKLLANYVNNTKPSEKLTEVKKTKKR
ncbi:MAG: DEAD/DEAH box helicase [Flavobacteriaceae bacterium]